MNKGLWIGNLVLAVLLPVSTLRTADVKWQAVGEAPHREAPAATLEAPVALQASVVTAATPLMPLPGTIQPVSYETAIPVVEPPTRKPTPEIIAVSAPLERAGPALDGGARIRPRRCSPSIVRFAQALRLTDRGAASCAPQPASGFPEYRRRPRCRWCRGGMRPRTPAGGLACQPAPCPKDSMGRPLRPSIHSGRASMLAANICCGGFRDSRRRCWPPPVPPAISAFWERRPRRYSSAATTSAATVPSPADSSRSATGWDAIRPKPWKSPASSSVRAPPTSRPTRP